MNMRKMRYLTYNKFRTAAKRKDRHGQMYLLMTVFAFWDGRDAHQPQTGAAKQSMYHRNQNTKSLLYI